MKCPLCGADSRRTDLCELCGAALSQAAGPANVGLGAPMAPAPPRAVVQPVGPAPVPPSFNPVGPPQVGPPSVGPPQVGPPLAGATGPGLVGPPVIGQAAPQVRVSLTGEVVEVTQPVQTGADPGAYPTLAPPPPGSGAAVVSSPITGQHASYAMPASAMTPLMAQAQAHYYGPSAGEKLERCMAMVLPLLVVASLVAHFVPSTSAVWANAFAALFLVGILMGASAAVASYDDAYTEIGALLLGTMFLGPTLGLVIYGILGLIRQEWNSAIIAIGLATLLVPMVILSASGASPLLVTAWAMPRILDYLGFGMVAICTFGWIMSSLFRPMNE